MRVAKNQVTYPRKKVIAVLRTLNELVVSLDQIGSASYDMTEAKRQAALSDFMRPQDVSEAGSCSRHFVGSFFY